MKLNDKEKGILINSLVESNNKMRERIEKNNALIGALQDSAKRGRGTTELKA